MANSTTRYTSSSPAPSKPSVLMRDRFSTVDLVKFIGWLDDAFVDDVFPEMNAPVLTPRIAQPLSVAARAIAQMASAGGRDRAGPTGRGRRAATAPRARGFPALTLAAVELDRRGSVL